MIKYKIKHYKVSEDGQDFYCVESTHRFTPSATGTKFIDILESTAGVEKVHDDKNYTVRVIGGSLFTPKEVAERIFDAFLVWSGLDASEVEIVGDKWW